MTQGSTLFLKGVIVLIGLFVLALCIGLLPWLYVKDVMAHFPFYWLYPVLIGMYAAAIPFYWALYQALKLLSYIDQEQAFSGLSVTALKKIIQCAVIISVLYVIIMPFLYLMAQLDDAPGILIPGIVVLFASSVIAVFAAVLHRLLKNAIIIKYENDLTV